MTLVVAAKCKSVFYEVWAWSSIYQFFGRLDNSDKFQTAAEEVIDEFLQFSPWGCVW